MGAGPRAARVVRQVKSTGRLGSPQATQAFAPHSNRIQSMNTALFRVRWRAAATRRFRLISPANGPILFPVIHARTTFVVFSALAIAACGHPAPPHAAASGPNPNGCYVQVFDMNRFAGVSDILNGPMRYATLTTLPNGARWSKRIRSVRMGPIATAVSVGEHHGFQGTVHTDGVGPNLFRPRVRIRRRDPVAGHRVSTVDSSP